MNILLHLWKVEEIEVVMPNQHYFTIDMTKMGIANKNEVCWVINTNFENADLRHALLTFFPLAGSSSSW